MTAWQLHRKHWHYTSDAHKSITEQQCDCQNIKCMSYMLNSLKLLLECDLWIAKQSKIWLEHDFWNIIPSQTLDLNVTSSKCRVRIWVECDWTEQHLAWGGSWGIELMFRDTVQTCPLSIARLYQCLCMAPNLWNVKHIHILNLFRWSTAPCLH